MKTVQFKKISGTMPMLILFAGKICKKLTLKVRKPCTFMHYYHQTTPTSGILGPLGSWKLSFVVKFNA